MLTPRSLLRVSSLALAALVAIAAPCPQARAMERITLRSGAEFDCTRHAPTGDRIRLYLAPTQLSASTPQPDESYIEVSATSILRVDIVPDPIPIPATPLSANATNSATPATLRQMLAQAGASHDIDADLLASIVHAESNGNPRAVSPTGAQGLMQLMPATASALNVHNSFVPEENISGGTAYLDQLLTRYHDDIALAVAAYNAGPAAVDHYHGIPPYRETHAYVARVIREFNRRKRTAARSAAIHAPLATTLLAAN
jgi:soluble lytic murein transglycosylase-like protein